MRGAGWASGLVSIEFAVASIIWGLVEAPIAALVGASLYREEPARAASQ